MSAFQPKYYTAEEAKQLFDRQKAKRWAIAQTSAAERVAKLKKLLAAIKEQTEDICSAIQEDFGKHPAESRMTEIVATQEELLFSIKHLRRWMKPLRMPTPLVVFGSRSKVQYEPKGQALIFSPWNYPFNLSINPLIAAVAAGNTVILRPSEKTPKTSAALQRLISSVFPEDEAAVVLADRQVADYLLELPFDHFFFTGSPKVGQKVMCAAAKHWASVTLELGGKSPAIVDKSADLKQSAQRLVWGKYINGGQTCIAPDYLLLDKAVAPQFLEEVKAVIAKFYGATVEDQLNSPDLASLVNIASGERLEKLIDDSVAAGAKIFWGGKFSADKRRLSPTVVTDITADMALMSQEIFGPIMPVITFDHIDEAVKHIQNNPKPLALYLFAKDKAIINKIYSQTTSGGSCLNNTIMHLVNSNSPFGGVGMSGLGNYHGEYGFRTFSHERAILSQGKINVVDFLTPPYTEKVCKIIRLMLKYF